MPKRRNNNKWGGILMLTSKNFGLNLPSSSNDTDIADINVISENFSILDEQIPVEIQKSKKEIIKETEGVVYGAISFFNGDYTNLLKDIAEENSTTDNPTHFPAHKINVTYEQTWAYKLNTVTGYECYIFEAKQGDRFNLSGYNIASASAIVASVAIVDSAFGIIDNFNTALKSVKFCCGLYACPENTAYVIINKAIDGYTPFVTKVDEPVFNTMGGFVPNASKCLSALYNDTKHATYLGEVGGELTYSFIQDAVPSYYSCGIYPLECGKEYVICVPESIEYIGFGYICNENFVVNNIISNEDMDKNRRYVFIATENDKYIALNCCDFATIQFGENQNSKIKAGANIGNAFFDGKNDISLADMGVINRSINKKYIAYGDSITRGIGVNFVGGEKRWTDYLVERYNIPEHINMGVGYSSLAMKETYSEIPMSHDDRLNVLIAQTPDIVTILGGANDYIFNIPIGTEDDVTNKNRYTFKGAYAYIIDKILTAKPDTTIILLGMFKNTMGDYAEGKGAYPLEDYATATKEIAEYYGLPFVDLNECGFNSYNFNTTNGVFSTDGIHPNAEGTKRIAMVVSKWFDTFKGIIY